MTAQNLRSPTGQPFSHERMGEFKANRLRGLAHVGLIAAGVAFGMVIVLARQDPALGQSAKVGNPGASQQTFGGGKAVKEALPQLVSTERDYYTVCMNLIQREWELNHTARVLELLAETKNSRFRGFEWGYWNRLYHGEIRTLNHSASAVAVSADGTRFAIGTGQGTVTLLDSATGRELWTGKEKPVAGWAGWINAIAFTPDGTRLLTCDSESTMVDWDVKTGEPQKTLFGGYSGTRAAFSADGTHILLNSRGTWGAIRDVATGKDILTNKTAQYDQFYSIALAPNGKRFATSNSDNVVRIWDAETGKELFALPGHKRPIYQMVFSPDSRRLVTASLDRTAKVWDVETGRELHTLTGHLDEVWAARFSPDGKVIVTGSIDGTGKVWNAETGLEIMAIPCHTGSVNALAFTPDSRQFVTGGNDGKTKFWKVEMGQEALTPNDSVRSRPEPRNTTVYHVMHDRTFGPRAFSSDGKFVAVAAGNGVDVWDIPQGKKLFTLEGHTGKVLEIAFSLDSTRIATGGEDTVAKIWDLKTGIRLQNLKGHTGSVTTLAFLAGRAQIVTGSADGTAKVWNCDSGTELRTLKGHTDGLYAIKFFPNGKHIVTDSNDKTTRIWDSETGRQIGCLQAGGGLTGWMTLSQDGSRAATYFPYSVRLWNVKTGQEIRTLPVNSGYSRGIAFSPDYKRVFTGTSHRDPYSAMHSEFQIWDADTGRELLTLPNSSHQIADAHFSADGTRIHIDFLDGYVSDVRADAEAENILATR